MKRGRDNKEKKSSSIVDGFKKLAIATVIFGILWVLVFTFFWFGD